MGGIKRSIPIDDLVPDAREHRAEQALVERRSGPGSRSRRGGGCPADAQQLGGEAGSYRRDAVLHLPKLMSQLWAIFNERTSGSKNASYRRFLHGHVM